MNTILFAHSGSGNHGCEALVRTTSEVLGRRPVLFSTNTDEDYKYHVDQAVDIREDTISKVPRHSFSYFRAALQTKITKSTTLFTKYIRNDLVSQVKSGDLCLSIGGDNYCYGGTDILGNLNSLMKKKGGRTVLWGCSIDPEAITPAMVSDLKKYDLITVREPLTLHALQSAGVTANVRQVADTAFLLRPQSVTLPEGFLPGRTIGINVSPLVLKYTNQSQNALSAFYSMIQHILDTTDNIIALIPHVVKEETSDLEVLSPIYKKFKDTGRVILVHDHNCMELKYIISQCRLFIGARTHATIAAYSTCVPTLVVGYSVKSRGIAMDLFGTDKNYVLPIRDIRSPENLINAYTWLENHANEIHRQLQLTLPQYQEKARLGKKYLDELTAK